MQYLRYLGQLSYNPILILVMALVGLILSTFVKSIVQLAFAKPMGMKVTDIMIFGLKYTKLKNGKWEKRGRKAGVGLQVETAFDLEREAGMDSRKLIAKDKAYMILTAVVTLLIGIGAFAGLLIATFNVDSYLLASVLFLLGFWLLLFLIGKFFLAISVVSKVNSKKSLSGYTQEVLSMLRSGVPFEQMEMKPFSELNYKKVWDTEKQMYFLLYFEYLDANGFFDRMPEAVAEAERTMKPNMAYSKVVLGVCMDLVYYYSYHNIIPSMAKEYYHRIFDDITKDTDPNAMFVKGFYELNCFGNVDTAKDCVIKALEKIDDFSTGDEREYCRKCIARLNHAIDNFPKQN